jgi:hypothetical protein
MVQNEEKRGFRRRKSFVGSTCKREEEETKSERVEMVQEIEERETRRKRISTGATCKLDIKKRSGIRDMLQDGVGEAQDRKEYKREELQEVARGEKA